MNADGMNVGDAVEFDSDCQTEKGPSSGRVIYRNGSTVTIRHSDHSGEIFNTAHLYVKRRSTHHKGEPLWILE